jgi:hypothetical protein
MNIKALLRSLLIALLVILADGLATHGHAESDAAAR